VVAGSVASRPTPATGIQVPHLKSIQQKARTMTDTTTETDIPRGRGGLGCPHFINIRPKFEADMRHARLCELAPDDHETNDSGWVIHTTVVERGAETGLYNDLGEDVGYGPGTTCSDRPYCIRWTSPPE
jgi:hypothetical protein